jgi:hypothetical protein
MVENKGVAIAHFHGFVQRSALPPNVAFFGQDRQPLPCGSVESALLTIEEKRVIADKVLALEEDIDYAGESLLLVLGCRRGDCVGWRLRGAWWARGGSERGAEAREQTASWELHFQQHHPPNQPKPTNTKPGDIHVEPDHGCVVSTDFETLETLAHNAAFGLKYFDTYKCGTDACCGVKTRATKRKGSAYQCWCPDSARSEA